MTPPSSRDGNKWALTGDALAALLERLDTDPNRAAVEYERLRQRLSKLFQWRGCVAYDDYADMTLDRVAHLIASGEGIKTTNVYALCHGVAMNLAREYWRDEERRRKSFETAPPPAAPAHPEELLVRHNEAASSEARVRCLHRCLDRLPGPSLNLIRRYYAGGDVLDKDQRRHVAAGLGISLTALRVRAFRIRSDVCGCVEQCLERQGQP